jgi:hypothetical protein
MGIIRRRRRRGYRAPRDLRGYREDLTMRTGQIDTELGALADLIDALRRRDADASEALTRLHASEDQLGTAADVLREIVAPEELHRLHTEYEGNLARALRGILIAERGCALTRLPHRPPDDEEPFIYWKRAHQNILHAQLRMRELVAVLLAWEPGRPAEVTVATRLRRT